MNEGYTEYGYRGLEEIKRLEEKIAESRTPLYSASWRGMY